MYNKSHRIRVSRLGILYILTMVYAELFQAGIIKGYYLTAILVSFFWAVIGLLQYLSKGYNNCRYIQLSQYKRLYILLVFPWIVAIIYNVFLYVVGVGYQDFLKSSFVQIMFTPCILTGAFGAYYIFKNNTIRYFLYSVFVSYIITLFYQFIKLGPSDFFNGIMTLFAGNSVGNPFETNSDLVLALGVFVIFGYDSFIRKNMRERFPMILILILIILGGKKIEWAALVAIFIANIVCGFLTEKKRNRIQIVASFILIIVTFIFVYLVISGLLSVFVYSHGINTMGRMQMWDNVAKYSSFSPLYLGNGYSFSNLILEVTRVLTYEGHTYVLHSDILKLYFDLGFIMLLFWELYYLLFFPKRIRRYFGYKVGNFSWFVMVFLIILYFTDNAINYVLVQTMLVFVLLKAISVKNEEVR